ncbi:trimethylamine methyltransferase family protein [Chloroflexota bacterium]
MNSISNFYRPLSPNNIKRIDETARQILKTVGVKINDSSYLDKLSKVGAAVDKENSIVRFDEGWLSEMIKKAPHRYTAYSRDGKNDLNMGSGEVYFANGGRVFRILDMNTGGYRLTMLRDITNTAMLVDRLDNIRMYFISCQAHDLKQEYYHLNDFFEAFNHTTKHVMGGCTDLDGAKQVHALAGMIAGGEEQLAQKPFYSIITNPISPLTIEGNTLSIIEYCTQRGIPITCAPATIAGATGPATLAGNLAQLHAEALAGVALTQALTPGAKVLYGAVANNMDLRTMELTMGSVEMGMMNAAAVQLAKLYDLPIYGTGGLTESKRPDIQAGFEKNFSNLMVAMTGADLIHLAAGMLDSGNSISYEQYFIDNENIGMIQRILSGINVNDDTLALDVISGVGPGGNYVMEEHTVDHMMDEFFYPSLGVRCNFDVWEERGRPNMLKGAAEMVQKTLRECHECGEGVLDIDLTAEIEKAFPQIDNI